jgi:hypothetical protein
VARLAVVLMPTVVGDVCRDVWSCCSRRRLRKKVVADRMCWLGTAGGRCLDDVLARVLCLWVAVQAAKARWGRSKCARRDDPAVK